MVEGKVSKYLKTVWDKRPEKSARLKTHYGCKIAFGLPIPTELLHLSQYNDAEGMGFPSWCFSS